MSILQPKAKQDLTMYSSMRAQQRRFRLIMLGLACVLLLSFAGFPADNTKELLGTWSGRATGPQGGPPTGDIVVSIEKASAGMKGTITVKAPGGAQYSGQMGNIALKSRIFSATATFKLGENPLEVQVSGPLRGKTITGNFTVLSKGQKMGDGTFTITKNPAPPKSK